MTDQRPETLEEAYEALADGRLYLDADIVSPRAELAWVLEHRSELAVKPNPIHQH